MAWTVCLPSASSELGLQAYTTMPKYYVVLTHETRVSGTLDKYPYLLRSIINLDLPLNEINVKL